MSTNSNEVTTSDLDYDSIILESFKEAMILYKSLNQHIAPAETLVQVSGRVQPHLFFAAKTQMFIEVELFSDKDFRDFVYATLARLKYNCRVSGAHIRDIVSFIVDTGTDSEQLEKYTENKELSHAQSLFNDAYVTTAEYRRALLECYEWGIIVFLSNMYFIHLCSIMRELTTEEK